MGLSLSWSERPAHNRAGVGSSPTRRISSKVGYLAAATASKELKLDTVIKIAAGTPARECADV